MYVVQALLSFFGLLASLLLSFISSGMETALYRVSRVRMRVRSEQGDGRANAVLAILDKLDSMVTTILINNNIAAYAGTYFLTIQLVQWRVPHSELITTAVITPLFFVLTESFPKQLAYANADVFALEFSRAFSLFRVVYLPAVWLLNYCSSLLRRLFGAGTDASLSQSQRSLLLEHLSAGVAEKVLTEEQNRMAVRIMQLEGLSAGDSMIPLRKLTLMAATSTRERALTEMSRRKVRLALLIDAAGRPTSHVITMTDLLMNPGQPRDPVDTVARRLERVRAGVAIPEVLNLFRKHHTRLALIVQSTRVVGLISTESVLDRIAGITERHAGQQTRVFRP